MCVYHLCPTSFDNGLVLFVSLFDKWYIKVRLPSRFLEVIVAKKILVICPLNWNLHFFCFSN